MAQVSGTTTDTRHLGEKAELTTNRQPPISNNRVGPVIGYLDNRGYTLGYTLTASPCCKYSTLPIKSYFAIKTCKLPRLCDYQSHHVWTSPHLGSYN